MSVDAAELVYCVANAPFGMSVIAYALHKLQPSEKLYPPHEREREGERERERERCWQL